MAEVCLRRQHCRTSSSTGASAFSYTWRRSSSRPPGASPALAFDGEAMSPGLVPDEDLVRRLPTPLAQLYRRAHNAKTPLDRHLTAFAVWEVALKLLGSAAVVSYAGHDERAPELVEAMSRLARPTLGDWWKFVRLLVPLLADAGDDGFRAVRSLVLGRTRDDLPRATGLDALLRKVLEGSSGSRVTLRVSELFDRLINYRNRVL